MPTVSCDDDGVPTNKSWGMALDHHFENLKAIFATLQSENAMLRESCALVEDGCRPSGKLETKRITQGPGATLAPPCPKPAVPTSRSVAESSIFAVASGLRPGAANVWVSQCPATSHTADARSNSEEKYNGLAKVLENDLPSGSKLPKIFSLGEEMCTPMTIGAASSAEERTLTPNTNLVKSPEDDFSPPEATIEPMTHRHSAPSVMPSETGARHHSLRQSLAPTKRLSGPEAPTKRLSGPERRLVQFSGRGALFSHDSAGSFRFSTGSHRRSVASARLSIASEQLSDTTPLARNSANSPAEQDPDFDKFQPTSRKNRRQMSIINHSCALKSSSMTDVFAHTKELGNAQRCLPRLVGSTTFELVFFLVVCSNIALLGLETNYRALNVGSDDPLEFTIARYIYFVIFLVELLLRLFSVGPHVFFRGADSVWNMFDLITVVFAGAEAIVTAVWLMSGGQDSESDSISLMSFLRLARGLRLLRLLRLVRVMRFLVALQTLCKSIYGTMKSLLWAIFLLLLIIYGFALLFTHASADARERALQTGSVSKYNNDLEIYFGHVGNSMQTLFMSMCNGVSWEVAYRSLQDINVAWAQSYNAFVTFTYFCVLNILTANFCQTAIEHAQSDQDSIVRNVIARKAAYKNLLRRLYNQIDTNRSGAVSLKEMTEHFEDESVQAYFNSLDLDPADAWALFKLLDADGGDNIDIDEFVDGCMRLRGQARAIDLATVMAELNWLAVEMCDFMNAVEEKLAQLALQVRNSDVVRSPDSRSK